MNNKIDGCCYSLWDIQFTPQESLKESSWGVSNNRSISTNNTQEVGFRRFCVEPQDSHVEISRSNKK
jgi:hypothetical protein